MAGLTPGQEGADGGGRTFKLPPVDGWCWTSDRLAISREWAASKKNRGAPWNVIAYPAVSSVYRDGKGIAFSRPDGLAVAIGSAALKSLEACTLLADGLSSNPAVAPAAAELLKPHLKTARDRRDAEIAKFARRQQGRSVRRDSHLVVFRAGLRGRGDRLRGPRRRLARRDGGSSGIPAQFLGPRQ
jgi:hypothetical protein